MPQPYFRFKQFTVYHDRCAMKVSTDACLFGAWCAEALRADPPANLLDIGAGTGLLSLMIAQQCPTRIEAVEIDSEAAAQAARNVAAAPFDGITIREGDVLELPLGQYACIVSNPPFYENEISTQDPARQVAHHSGGLRWPALFSFLKRHLTGGGNAFLLLPYKRRADLLKLATGNGLHLQALATVHPTPGHAPARLLVRLGLDASTLREEVIHIKVGEYYSERFTELLKPYYLYL
ncbi:MAG: methyltransferase domain-containing protein [Chitinophagaceae bacterium]|nr:MAG: methyltransferase domain-containing protein [Chitinophagaceae bacterium]